MDTVTGLSHDVAPSNCICPWETEQGASYRDLHPFQECAEALLDEHNDNADEHQVWYYPDDPGRIVAYGKNKPIPWLDTGDHSLVREGTWRSMMILLICLPILLGALGGLIRRVK